MRRLDFDYDCLTRKTAAVIDKTGGKGAAPTRQAAALVMR
jgi:hypothetical protein